MGKEDKRHMTISGEELILHSKKVMVLFVRTSYRSSRAHPLVFSLVFCILMLYGSFPSLFGFLVSVSPVIVCTTLLLGLLLSYGAPNIPETEEDDKGTREVSSWKIEATAMDLVAKKNQRFLVENHVGNRTEIQEIGEREALLSQRDDSAHKKSEGGLCTTSTRSEGDEKVDIVLTAGLMGKYEKLETQDEDKLTQNKELQHPEILESKGISVEKPAEVKGVSKKVGGSFTIDPLQGRILAIAEAPLDDQFDSTLGSPWLHIDRHDASFDSVSDHTQSSSPSASMIDTTPMLDELHPLLGSEHPQCASISKDDSNVASQELLLGNGSDDDGNENKAKNHENEKDKEAYEEKDDVTIAAVEWTKDDQKHVMDLGSFELERSQRLESLILKRRARKNIRFLTGNNPKGTDYLTSMDKVSHFHFHIPHISATRHNPFRSPDDSGVSMGLPPIPSSAPSCLADRGNPFDYLYDLADEHSSHIDENWEQEFMSGPNCEMFRSIRSFNVEGMELEQERHCSRFDPNFGAERMDSEQECSFQRKFSNSGDLMVSSTPASVTTVEHDAKRKVESIDVEEEMNDLVTNDRGIVLDTKFVIEETCQDNDFGSVEEHTREEIEIDSPISDAEGLKVIEENHDKASYSFSSEADGVISKSTFHEELAKLEKTWEHSEIFFSNSNLFDMGDKADDYQFPYPISDSSTLATEEAVSRISISNGGLLDADNEASSASSSWMQTEVLGVESSQVVPDLADDKSFINLLSIKGSTVEKFLSQDEGLLMTPQVIVFTEVNETQLKESNKVRQHDIIEKKLSTVQGDYGHLFSPVFPEPPLLDIMNDLSSFHDLSSLVTESSESAVVDMISSTSKEGNMMVDALTSFSEVSHFSGDLVLSKFEKALLVRDKPQIQSQSSTDDFGKPHTSILDFYPIPEGNLEDLEPAEEELSSSNPNEICLSGLQTTEKPYMNILDIKQFPSTDEASHSLSSDFLIHDLESHNPSVLITDVSSHHGAMTEFQLVELSESMDFPVLPMMKPVFEVKFSRDSAESRDVIQNAVWGGKKVLDKLESSDENHPEVLEATDIDESLLSELDAVGDFHAEEITPDQLGFELMMSSDVSSDCVSADPSSCGLHVCPHEPEVSIGKYSVLANMPPSISSGADLGRTEELHSVVNNLKDMESEVGTSSFWSSNEDLEGTVYNPMLQILASCSIQEMVSVMTTPHEEDMILSLPDLRFDKSLATDTVLEPGAIVIAQGDHEQRVTDTDLLVLEAKSVEDTHSATQQITEEHVFKPMIPEVIPSQK
ncbi:UV radiation resistance [Musa troglodytarum]|uniref:UV radiation resistance n=1 Tax=Musa troglodytarum TaxID=320322 RepID=A0A9E7K7T2_9LILI|nr:UV radiation resistance [Musa troglodytarum]